AAALWEAVVGETVARPDRFITALFTQFDGRLANLYDAVAELDAPRQRFALGLWMADPMARVDAMRSLGSVVTASVEWRGIRGQPFVRQTYALSAALMRVTVDAAGRPGFPASRAFWTSAIESVDLPTEPLRAAASAAEDAPIDAAWVAALAADGDARV